MPDSQSRRIQVLRKNRDLSQKPQRSTMSHLDGVAVLQFYKAVQASVERLERVQLRLESVPDTSQCLKAVTQEIPDSIRVIDAQLSERTC